MDPDAPASKRQLTPVRCKPRRGPYAYFLPVLIPHANAIQEFDPHSGTQQNHSDGARAQPHTNIHNRPYALTGNSFHGPPLPGERTRPLPSPGVRRTTPATPATSPSGATAVQNSDARPGLLTGSGFCNHQENALSQPMSFRPGWVKRMTDPEWSPN